MFTKSTRFKQVCQLLLSLIVGYINFLESTARLLQVQEKRISHLPVEIYVQLPCFCCVRILGQLSGYWAT